MKKLAERMGVRERDFAKPNKIGGFAIISRNLNDLASSNLGRRFRLILNWTEELRRALGR